MARPAGPRSGPARTLTGRQRAVLALVAQGRTNAEIATELGIGFETVKMHVSDVLDRLQVATREEAGAWWLANGDAEPPTVRPHRLAPLVSWLTLGRAAAIGAGGILLVGAIGIALAIPKGRQQPAPEEPPPPIVSRVPGLPPALQRQIEEMHANAPVCGTGNPVVDPPPGSGEAPYQVRGSGTVRPRVQPPQYPGSVLVDAFTFDGGVRGTPGGGPRTIHVYRVPGAWQEVLAALDAGLRDGGYLLTGQEISPGHWSCTFVEAVDLLERTNRQWIRIDVGQVFLEEWLPLNAGVVGDVLYAVQISR